MRRRPFSSATSAGRTDVHVDDRTAEKRTYSSIAQARPDGNNARVWGGMHYPSTVGISDAEGEAIANYVNQHFMQPLHGGK